MIYAMFKGENSMGFKRGKTYNLRTEIKPVPGVLKPCLCVFDTNSINWCPYSSLEKFLENWKIIDEKY